MPCLRKVLKISWRDRILNHEILRRTRSKPLSLLAKERRLQYLGHVIQQMALNWTPQGGKE